MPLYIKTIDIVVIVLYFAGCIAVGIYSMFRSTRNSVTGYFLAGKMMTWIPIGASLFASNIGSEHFIGLAGSGAAGGISTGAFEFNACIILQLLGWVFLPVYISSKAATLPEYMARRFQSNRIQVYLAILSLLLYILTKISVNLYSASLFIRVAMGWNMWISITSLLLMTALITITGGLTAVMYTDTMQCVVMITGAIVLSGISLWRIDGFSGLLEKYPNAIASVANQTELDAVHTANLTHCYLPSEDAFRMLRSADDDYMPWLGFLLGQTPVSIWYWCTDQMMVQRTLSAKSLQHAQAGVLLAGCIKLLPLFIMVIPGMISRILYPDVIACATPSQCLNKCGQASGCSNMAYPLLVMHLMPDGVRGLMLAVMLAALMSDLTSIFNSSSTLFTVDLWPKIRKRCENKELMIVGRLSVVVMTVISIIWVLVIEKMQGGELYIYIQTIGAYLAPAIPAAFILAISWPRINEIGTFSGLVYGLVIGLAWLFANIGYPKPNCDQPDNRPTILKRFHYMYFALFSTLSTGTIIIVVSLLTKASDPDTLKGTILNICLRSKKSHNHEVNSKELETCNAESYELNPISSRSNETKDNHTQNDNSLIEIDQPNLFKDISNEKDENKDVKIVQTFSKFSECKCNLACMLFWICGYDVNEKYNSEDTENPTLNETTKIPEKNSTIKKILTALMIILVTFTTFPYIFFSLYFGKIKVGKIPMRN